VFCILSPQRPDDPRLTTLTKLDFTIDGVDGPVFEQQYQGTDLAYNVPVYTNTALTNTKHQLVVSLYPQSVMLFDYAIYT
jgi:hypothetical protein